MDATTPNMLGIVASVFTQLNDRAVSNFLQQLSTARNKMQQGVESEAASNIQNDFI